MAAGGFPQQSLIISPSHIKFPQRMIMAEITWTVRQNTHVQSDQRAMTVFSLFGNRPQAFANFDLQIDEKGGDTHFPPFL